MKTVQDLGHNQHATDGNTGVERVLLFAFLADLLVEHLLPPVTYVLFSLPHTD